MRTGSCDFVFATVRSSAVQNHSTIKRPSRSPSSWQRDRVRCDQRERWPNSV
jgi:hypothetical protein